MSHKKAHPLFAGPFNLYMEVLLKNLPLTYPSLPDDDMNSFVDIVVEYKEYVSVFQNSFTVE